MAPSDDFKELFSEDHIHDFVLPEGVKLKCEGCGNSFPLEDIMSHLMSIGEPSDEFKES